MINNHEHIQFLTADLRCRLIREGTIYLKYYYSLLGNTIEEIARLKFIDAVKSSIKLTNIVIDMQAKGILVGSVGYNPLVPDDPFEYSTINLAAAIVDKLAHDGIITGPISSGIPQEITSNINDCINCIEPCEEEEET